MTSLATIIRQYGTAYQAKYGNRLLPSHQRTLRDIADCRTATLGGHVYHCDVCEKTHYQYHSCQNRHCPQCQHNQGQQWLERQQAALLPVPYFMVTFTIPSGLHEIARAHQKTVYNILFRSSAAALQELAWDPRYVGGQIGMVGVLHTWGRKLNYHPHVHYLVPAGGLSADGENWLSARGNFLIPVKALSILFRAKFRDALKEAGLFDQVPAQVWQKDWVTHCKPVGKGEGALKYLAPYIFRVAIGNRRILKVNDGKVTFRYRESDTGTWRTCTLQLKNSYVVFYSMSCQKALSKFVIMACLAPVADTCYLCFGYGWEPMMSSKRLNPSQSQLLPLSPARLVVMPCAGYKRYDLVGAAHH